ALRQLAAGGTSLVVTVDCGIASCREAEEARRLGLELVVTDHHEFKEELPGADVLVHPRLPGHAYPFGGLSGAGVAFKVAWLLCQRASDLATYLESQNQQRQQIERKIVAEARALAADGPHRDAPALVLASADWHAGVIGIVAGRLAEQLGRPVLLVALRGDGSAPGSGRSIPGFALHEALRHCSDHLLSHGGHAAAAGFRIAPDRIDTFREHFCAYAARHFPAGPPAPALVLDAELPLSALTPGLLAQIDRLEPYGAQNPRPKFLAADLEVVGEPRRIGGGERHLTFRVRQGSTAVRVIA